MFTVTYRDTETGQEFTKTFDKPGYHNEREAMRLVTTVDIMSNLELVSTNVDVSKFRV